MKTLFPLSIILPLLLALSATAQTYPPDTTYEIIPPPPDAQMPDYLESYNNLTTNTQIKRITRQCDIVPSGYPTHGYAKTQIWNVDATMYKWGSNAIYDAQTHELIKDLDGDGVWVYFSLWSNTDPDIIYGFRDSGLIRKYTVSTDNLETILDLNEDDEYQIFRLGFGEGNMDIHDTYAAMAANPIGTEDITVFIVDLQDPQVVSSFNFVGAWGDADVHSNAAQYLNWVSVSQSGQYVGFSWDHGETSADDPYFDQNGNGHYGVEIFHTSDLSFHRRIVTYGNHGDFGFTPAGEEVYVQFWGQGEGDIFAYHLDSGQADVILVQDQFSGGGAYHISCRNYLRPGWAYANTPFANDGRVIAVKLDGSEIIENFGHCFATNSARPVPSPLGDKVLITSDFGGTPGEDELYEFELSVIDDGPPTHVVGEPLKEGAVSFVLSPNSPNPFNHATNFAFELRADADQVRLTVYDVAGRLMATLWQGPLPAGRHQQHWAPGGAASGVYFYRLQVGDLETTRRCVWLR